MNLRIAISNMKDLSVKYLQIVVIHFYSSVDTVGALQEALVYSRLSTYTEQRNIEDEEQSNTHRITGFLDFFHGLVF
jgi:hypothetical protein